MCPANDVRLFDLSGSFTDGNINAIAGMINSPGKEAYEDERVRLAEQAKFSVDNIAYGYQIHSATVNLVGSGGYAGEGDGLITANSEVALTIQVADCVPLFIHSRDNCVLGLFHVGWRGAIAGIVEKGISLMANHLDAAPAQMEAVLGPAIGPCCYEVKEDVADRFPNIFLSRKDEEQHCLDLPAFVRTTLINAGVFQDNIHVDRRCTFCSDEGFHSFRRDGDSAGRIICFFGRK